MSFFSTISSSCTRCALSSARAYKGPSSVPAQKRDSPPKDATASPATTSSAENSSSRPLSSSGGGLLLLLLLLLLAEGTSGAIKGAWLGGGAQPKVGGAAALFVLDGEDDEGVKEEE